MPSVSMILLLSWNAIFIKKIGLAVAKDECSSKADCHTKLSADIVCCKGHSRDSERPCTPYNCDGHFCFTDGDCARSECCIDAKCTDSFRCRRCDSNGHCASGEYCCKRGHYPNVCRRSCVGEECAENTHCGGPREHCDNNGKCENREKSCSLSDGTIARIICGVLLPLIAIALCTLLWYCYHTNTPGSHKQGSNGNDDHSQTTTTYPPSLRSNTTTTAITSKPTFTTRRTNAATTSPTSSIDLTNAVKDRTDGCIPTENVNNPET
ncbi:Hypothetical predicted protein [Paramuricea clavata]|uniref:Uncharacterized protein n=1 Tax=Paramuricea clavata TaxID=317549 RepID=A0A7D9K4W0_PARCT|nr:Hypothetical predicted protein [Paramuricea clavata]